MKLIPDDPIVACILRTGHPPWDQEDEGYDDDDFEGDGEVFYGNETDEF